MKNVSTPSAPSFMYKNSVIFWLVSNGNPNPEFLNQLIDSPESEVSINHLRSNLDDAVLRKMECQVTTVVPMGETV